MHLTCWRGQRGPATLLVEISGRGKKKEMEESRNECAMQTNVEKKKKESGRKEVDGRIPLRQRLPVLSRKD